MFFPRFIKGCSGGEGEGARTGKAELPFFGFWILKGSAKHEIKQKKITIL